MLRRLYDWVMGLAAHPQASLWLFIVAFMESSFFPIPPHIMLIPMVIADRAKAWRYATIVTVGSVLGGIAGYFIGYALFDQVGLPVLEFLRQGRQVQAVRRGLQRLRRLDRVYCRCNAVPIQGHHHCQRRHRSEFPGLSCWRRSRRAAWCSSSLPVCSMRSANRFACSSKSASVSCSPSSWYCSSAALSPLSTWSTSSSGFARIESRTPSWHRKLPQFTSSRPIAGAA